MTDEYSTEAHLPGLAFTFAAWAHDGQVDKSGERYIHHPRRVARRVQESHPRRDDLIAAAWLHDVLEDTEVTWQMLADRFGTNVATIVEALTHRKNEPRADYYARILACPGAAVVKLADIDDNTDPKRLALLDEATRARLVEKYAKARAALA